MIVKTYYRDGRTNTFDTANLTDVSMYRRNVVTNWSLDLSGAIREGGMLLLSMRWYPALGQDAPAQAVSAHRTLGMLIGDGADGIDIETEVCRLMGFDPATYALAEELVEVNAEEALRTGFQDASN
ncbi:hypothetical protein [Olsenella uli]|mgnify:CR=1 FL=1